MYLQFENVLQVYIRDVTMKWKFSLIHLSVDDGMFLN